MGLLMGTEEMEAWSAVDGYAGGFWPMEWTKLTQPGGPLEMETYVSVFHCSSLERST